MEARLADAHASAWRPDMRFNRVEFRANEWRQKMPAFINHNDRFANGVMMLVAICAMALSGFFILLVMGYLSAPYLGWTAIIGIVVAVAGWSNKAPLVTILGMIFLGGAVIGNALWEPRIWVCLVVIAVAALIFWASNRLENRITN